MIKLYKPIFANYIIRLLMSSLIKPSTTKFLTGLIPAAWIETIFEYENFYYIHVSGDSATENQWEGYKNLFKKEFNENLDSMYQCSTSKFSFEVYLKKS